jgi:hypothetical protein
MAQRVTILLSPSHLKPQFDDYESIETLKRKNPIKMKKKTSLQTRK